MHGAWGERASAGSWQMAGALRPRGGHKSAFAVVRPCTVERGCW